MKKIVISAISLREGGGLSILNDCIKAVASYKRASKDPIEVTVLCHKKNLLVGDCSNIHIIEYPKSTRSYFMRIYYEYIQFYFLSKRIKPDVWFSLHDMTPNVFAKKRFVYCHNPTPFYKTSWKMFRLSWKEYLFVKFYKYLYKIFIKKNSSVIVQQHWIGSEMVKTFEISEDMIIVSRPIINLSNQNIVLQKEKNENGVTRFIYPSLPRTFKNFEVLFSAVGLLNSDYYGRFEVDLTLNGLENKYAKYLYSKFQDMPSINWLGYINRDILLRSYVNYDSLVFCSKLETFGLPIEEFKSTGKLIILPNLPYAHETLGSYRNALFFDPNSPCDLSQLMRSVIDGTSYGNLIAGELNYKKYKQVNGWVELLNVMFEK